MTGLLSEKLATRKYGTEKEGFSNHLEVLNWAQSVCCCIWAWLILQALILAGAVKSNETVSHKRSSMHCLPLLKP